MRVGYNSILNPHRFYPRHSLQICVNLMGRHVESRGQDLCTPPPLAAAFFRPFPSPSSNFWQRLCMMWRRFNKDKQRDVIGLR